MTVKDIFKKKFVTIFPNAKVYEAAKLIFGEKHSVIPVVMGKKNKLVGFITDQDITSDIFPSIKDIMEDFVHERDFEEMEKKIKPILVKKVKDVMSKRGILLHLEDLILNAGSVMKIKDVRGLPVADDNKHLVGIISKGDIFRALVRPEIIGFN